MTTCTTCNQVINEVITIDGKPYGTTCAERKLGINHLPAWFRGGDWDSAKTKHDKLMLDNSADFARIKEITSRSWSEWIILSKISHKAQREQNDFASNFIESIMSQLGYYTRIANVKFESMEDAEKGWKEYNGGFPYLNKCPRPISDLSEKQVNLLYKLS